MNRYAPSQRGPHRRYATLLAATAATLLTLLLTATFTAAQAPAADTAAPTATPAPVAQPADANATAAKPADAATPDAKASDTAAPADTPAATDEADAPKTGMAAVQDKIDKFFKDLVGWIAPILFVNVGVKYNIPLIVVVLVCGGIFFTLFYGFINVRLFGHSIRVIRGHYDSPDDHGEITHFQALTSALSATVGLGNIAGVAVAITAGGPGAVFWMWLVAFFGMSMKFSSCTLAQMYRRVGPEEEDAIKPSEHVLGGPFLYLDRGLRETIGGGFGAALGKIFAVLFALFAIGGSIGGGNMFQGNQTFKVISEATGLSHDWAWAGGLVMAVLVGVVIIGGIRRIGEVTSKLVPAMCVFYSTVCAIIILANVDKVPAMFADIFHQAFSPQAVYAGGLVGVLIQGAKRASFSNEAGLGSAAIAHSAAKTDEPVREGIVAMIGPFIDTHVVCTMTALAILITGSQLDPSGQPWADIKGVTITTNAFASLASWLPYLLMIAVFVFAYSTMISWSYYGERAAEYLFGKGAIVPYRVIYLGFVMIGPMVSLTNLMDFTDLLILSMAYPNIIGMLILAPKVRAAARDYAARLRSGEMKPER
ncbi:MAG: amino acid carrier protein [Phycisphaera sp.]|nr:amino acid carrier protein [Phycisphaera sp.]